jgi:hypothetical protein
MRGWKDLPRMSIGLLIVLVMVAIALTMFSNWLWPVP